MPVFVKTVVKKGELKWNLPPIIQPIIYRPGQTLHIEITVTNPQEDTAQKYHMGMALTDPRTGAILLVNNTPQQWGLKIDLEKKTFTLADEITEFQLDPKESLTITGDVTFRLTNCVLGLGLLDPGPPMESITNLYALLREPVIDITRMMTPLMTIAILATMIPMIEKALKRAE